MGYEDGQHREDKRFGSADRYNGDNRGNYNNSGSGSKDFSNNRPYIGRSAPYSRDKKERDFDLDPPTFYKPYTATGTEDCPEEDKRKIEDTIKLLDKHGFTLRHSVMRGLDVELISKITVSKKEEIIPFKDFDQSTSKFYFSTPEAKFLAKITLDNYDELKPVLQAFAAKNVRLVCGNNLQSPSMFVIVWSSDGCELPKNKNLNLVHHIVDIAHRSNIRVFNFKNTDADKRLIRFIGLNHE